MKKAFKSERHGQILRILEEQQFASVAYLSETLYASMPTVRRDLTYLESEGYIRRSHGGAMLSDVTVNVPIAFRSGQRSQEKQRMCRAARTLIHNGDVLFTDASSTVLPLLSLLGDTENVTVVTNGLKALSALADKDSVAVFSTGGRLVRSSQAFVGADAAAFVASFNADMILFSSSSLSADGRVTDYAEEETILRRAMFRHARSRVLLCDSSKVGTESAFNLCELDELDAVITDAPLPDSMPCLAKFSLSVQDGAYVYQKK